MKFKLNWVLTGILVLATVLRIPNISRYPAGFTADEADLGYNAYSILKTGMDEWGTPWWKLFFTNMRSFGDYKLPLYSFLTIPSIAILGLNEFAVRLPSAVFGTLSIIGVYFMAKKLYPARGEILGILSATIIAISPWHIQLSRGAFEANLITFFLPWAIYFFLSKRYTFALSSIALSFYSYHTARYLAPFLLLILVLYEKIKPTRKHLVSVIVFILISFPAIVAVIGVGKTRVTDLSILSPTDNWFGVASRRFEARNLGLPDPIARLFSNKVTQTFTNITKNYLSYLSPDFLFINGASESTYGMMPGRGVLYPIEIIFIISYLILLIQTKSKQLIFLGLLLLICPIPAVLAKSSGNSATRVAPMIPILSIMVSIGIINFLATFKKHKKFLTIAIIIVYAISLTFFLEDYFYHGPKLNAPSMSYGWRELMPRLSGIAREYGEVQVSRSLSEPQIFVAFYEKIDPVYFQSQSRAWTDFDKKGLKFLDQYDGYSLGKYRFGNLNLDSAKLQKTLLVGKPLDIPESYGQYFSIFYPDGKPAIQVSKSL